MAVFELEQFDPCPLGASGQLDEGQKETQLIALDIQSKYLFVDEDGATYHEYAVPARRTFRIAVVMSTKSFSIATLHCLLICKNTELAKMSLHMRRFRS